MTPFLVQLLEDMNQVELGDRIRLQRRAKGMSQDDVAADGCSTAYLSRIECGHRKPTPALLAYIADQLKVDVEQLLDVTLERSHAVPRDYAHAQAAAVALSAWLREPGDHLAYRRMVLAARRWEMATAEPAD